MATISMSNDARFDTETEPTNQVIQALADLANQRGATPAQPAVAFVDHLIPQAGLVILCLPQPSRQALHDLQQLRRASGMNSGAFSSSACARTPAHSSGILAA
jgi:hypothetical protein